MCLNIVQHLIWQTCWLEKTSEGYIVWCPVWSGASASSRSTRSEQPKLCLAKSWQSPGVDTPQPLCVSCCNTDSVSTDNSARGQLAHKQLLTFMNNRCRPWGSMRGTDHRKWSNLHFFFLKYHLSLSLYRVVGEVAWLDWPSTGDVLGLCSYTCRLVYVSCLNRKE